MKKVPSRHTVFSATSSEDFLTHVVGDEFYRELWKQHRIHPRLLYRRLAFELCKPEIYVSPDCNYFALLGTEYTV